ARRDGDERRLGAAAGQDAGTGGHGQDPRRETRRRAGRGARVARRTRRRTRPAPSGTGSRRGATVHCGRRAGLGTGGVQAVWVALIVAVPAASVPVLVAWVTGVQRRREKAEDYARQDA